MRLGSTRRPMIAVLVALLSGPLACSSNTSADTAWHPGQPLKLAVGSYFAPGVLVRDAYSGTTATVDAGGSVTLSPEAGGVILLERADATPAAFTWQNATVYFAMTDRFANGDPLNDTSYGRAPSTAADVGGWHGGDWKGLTARLDYIKDLGATAIWISPLVEQVHGWVSGGGGAYRNYGYHGYWALDFTRLDANFGTEAELQELVDQAHLRGLRVLADVVMNHPGYATGDDLVAYLPEVFKDGTGDAFKAFTPSPPRGYDAVYDLIDYRSTGWQSWWSPPWIRIGSATGEFPGFTHPGSDDLTMSLTFLPDFITEGTQAAGRPTLFARKVDSGFTVELRNPDDTGFTVRQYLVKWHADWVRKMGFDGFRCDTAKHVEKASWKALKDAGVAALADWKAANPGKVLTDADLPFWTVGEVLPHGVVKDDYFTAGGFDSLINSTYQDAIQPVVAAGASLADGADVLDALYAGYAGKIAADPAFDVLSYLSSHDTHLFLDGIGNDLSRQRQAGTALLLTPGSVQIFYGDESGRLRDPAARDAATGSRSDMNWADLADVASPQSALRAHWKRLGDFRRRHAAVGAGAHEKLASPAGTYAFGRRAGGDGVVVLLAGTK